MQVEAGGILKDIVEVMQGFLGIRSVCPFIVKNMMGLNISYNFTEIFTYK